MSRPVRLRTNTALTSDVDAWLNDSEKDGVILCSFGTTAGDSVMPARMIVAFSFSSLYCTLNAGGTRGSFVIASAT